jgi:hypothetical protein
MQLLRVCNGPETPEAQPPRQEITLAHGKGRSAMRTTRMKNLALLLSLLALAALGLVACGGGDDDDQSAAASETETSIHSAAIKAGRQLARARPHELADSALVRDFEAERRIARARRHELAADNTADNKSCGYLRS